MTSPVGMPAGADRGGPGPVPAISVVMCVYNGEEHLAEAMRSILDQTFGDFEFIIVDDGSTDGTARILEEFTDPRIVRLTNPKNSGICHSCNRGIAVARAPYVARIDADDLSAPDRFQTQYDYLQSHPEVSLMATSHTIINGSGESIGVLEIPDEEMLPWVMIWRNCIGQSSIMMRRPDLLELGGYEPSLTYAEDWDLCTRFLIAGKKIGTASFCFSKRRKSPIRASVKHAAADDCVRKVLRNYLGWVLGKPISGDDERRLEGFLNLSRRNPDACVSDFVAANGLVRALYRAVLRRTGNRRRPAIREVFSTHLLLWADLLELYHSPKSWRIVLEALRYSPGLIVSREFWREFRGFKRFQKRR